MDITLYIYFYIFSPSVQPGSGTSRHSTTSDSNPAPGTWRYVKTGQNSFIFTPNTVVLHSRSTAKCFSIAVL